MTAEGRLARERRDEKNRKERERKAQIKLDTLAKQQVELGQAADAANAAPILSCEDCPLDAAAACASSTCCFASVFIPGWNDLEVHLGNDGRSGRALSKQSEKLGEGKQISHRGNNPNTFLQSSFSSSCGFAPPKKNSGSLSDIPSGRVGQNTAADAETQTELLPGIPELQLLQPVKT
jgi:hypothetical protein